MHYIVRLGENLFVDLESGRCRRTKMPQKGEQGEKLTYGQLKLFAFLVKNREHVCEIGALEGLFDSGLDEEQTAGIKQQIQRIKNKLQSVDRSFDSRRAKDVFQSVPRVGYMFHLPEDGEILEIGAPTDALRRLDAAWFADARKMGEKEREAVREALDRMDGSWENALQASALGMCVHNAGLRSHLRNFSEFVFQKDGARGVVNVASVGAEGKTVLLAEFARMCAEEHPNWNVYEMDLSKIEPNMEAMQGIIDFLRQKGIGKIRRCILLMDAPDVLDRRFELFLYKILTENQPWLYVVFTNRVFTMTLAYQQPQLDDLTGFIRVYLLDPEAREEFSDVIERTFCIRNDDGTKRKVEIDWEKIEEMREKERLKEAVNSFVAVPRASVKREVMEGIVMRRYAPFNDVKEALIKRLPGLPYDERSYTDLYLMLLGPAARMSEDDREEVVAYNACRGNTIWDNWKSVTGLLDDRCIGYRLISEMFPYMAIMWIFGIPVTVEFLCRAAGREIEGEMRWMLDKAVGNDVFLEGEKLVQPDKDVLYACFYMHPEVSAARCITEILQSTWLDEELLESTIGKIFMPSMDRDREGVPFSIDMLKLSIVTLRNHLYMKMLTEKGIADIPELANLWFRYEPGIFQGTLSRTVISFTAAFERLVEEERRRNVRIRYWLDFLDLAAYYFESIPDFMMDFYAEQDEKTKDKMFTGAENSFKNGRYYREAIWKENMDNFLEELRGALCADSACANHGPSGGMAGDGDAGEADALSRQKPERAGTVVTDLEAEDEEELAGSDILTGHERPPMKNRLLNALLSNRQKQLKHLDMIAAEEKAFFEMLDALNRGESIDTFDSGEADDIEAWTEELGHRANRINTAYGEFQDVMAEHGEEEGIMLVTGRWSMFLYRLGLYKDAYDVLAYSERCLPESLEGMYWIYLQQGRVAKAGGPSSPGEEPDNPYFNLKEAERFYRKAYDNYLRYGNQNDLEPFYAILRTLAAFYHEQGETSKEERAYEELDKRMPSSRIRDEIHGRPE